LCSMNRFAYIHKSIQEQYAYYKEQWFPDEWGLPATGIIFYRGTTNPAFFSDRFHDVKNRQPRDQISVCWNLFKHNIKYKLMDFDVYNSPHRKVIPHVIDTFSMS
jgi:hypothetical protein